MRLSYILPLPTHSRTCILACQFLYLHIETSLMYFSFVLFFNTPRRKQGMSGAWLQGPAIWRHNYALNIKPLMCRSIFFFFPLLVLAYVILLRHRIQRHHSIILDLCHWKAVLILSLDVCDSSRPAIFFPPI